MKTISLLLALTGCLHGEILRLSKVVKTPGPGITQHDDGNEEKQTILVEDEGFITEKDIELVLPSQSQEDAVDVTLTADGTKKMEAATATMRPRIDRIAIVLNGKVKSAPTVQSVPLGKRFVINGLKGENEPQKLAGLLSGKTEDELEKQIADTRKRLASLPTADPPVFYTDEEYQQLAAEREKVGLHYMDRLYTEEDLEKLLAVGMTLAEVTDIFGKPFQNSTQDNGDLEMTFQTASEKFPIEKEFHLNSFIITFSAGKLASWRTFGSSKMTRTPKPQRGDPQPTNLIFKSPPADMSSEDFDIVTFIEGQEISLKPGETKPTAADVTQLLIALFSVSADFEEGKGIDPGCDIVSIVALKVPEVAALAKKYKGGKIPFSVLHETLKPYIFGDKSPF